MSDRVVVCIPTNFKSRQDIAAALHSKYGTDYVFLGRVLRAIASDVSCEIDICNADADLAHAFEIAGQNKISATTLQQINHHQVIYLTSVETGYDACLRIAQLAQVMLQIGGIAVKVDSAGIAHESKKWLANYNSSDVFEIYALFVVLVEGDEYYYSCGMHNFGKADVAIDLTEDISLAIYVMNVFNYYRLTESPILQDGHTFQPDIKCPVYQLKWIADREYEPDSLLYNSHGRWCLVRLGIS